MFLLQNRNSNLVGLSFKFQIENQSPYLTVGLKCTFEISAHLTFGMWKLENVNANPLIL
jgi:hypothetical protein